MASFPLPCLTCILFKPLFPFLPFSPMSSRSSSTSVTSAFTSMQAFQISTPLLLSFQMILALEVPTLLAHPHGNLHMFKTKLTISSPSLLTCISPCSSKEADAYCESSVWIRYREPFLCSCGRLLSSLSMAVISESKAGAWHSWNVQEGRWMLSGGGRLRVGWNQKAQAGAPWGRTVLT